MKEYLSAKHFARKLGDQRCSVIRPSKEAPNALKAVDLKLDLKPILHSAKQIRHECIVSFSQLRNTVKDELELADQVSGVKVSVQAHILVLLSR